MYGNDGHSNGQYSGKRNLKGSEFDEKNDSQYAQEGRSYAEAVRMENLVKVGPNKGLDVFDKMPPLVGKRVSYDGDCDVFSSETGDREKSVGLSNDGKEGRKVVKEWKKVGKKQKLYWGECSNIRLEVRKRVSKPSDGYKDQCREKDGMDSEVVKIDRTTQNLFLTDRASPSIQMVLEKQFTNNQGIDIIVDLRNCDTEKGILVDRCEEMRAEWVTRSVEDDKRQSDVRQNSKDSRNEKVAKKNRGKCFDSSLNS
ncbi:hypothetical protein LWI28_009511 [Acer negundo]|uniref:Uncharacterized protein n=1 Tax=Acer negundo TaxID=4023 RepID=A0AAD5P2M0_ACENE|nr:hypothetical protein LWI28_009511 [Acer negundo]